MSHITEVYQDYQKGILKPLRRRGLKCIGMMDCKLLTLQILKSYNENTTDILKLDVSSEFIKVIYKDQSEYFITIDDVLEYFVNKSFGKFRI